MTNPIYKPTSHMLEIVEGKSNTVSPKRIAEILNIPYYRALTFIHSGLVSYEKVKGRYYIDAEDFQRFYCINEERIKSMRDKYISLYWQGSGIQNLKCRAKTEFLENGIIYSNTDSFVDFTIYNHLIAIGNTDTAVHYGITQ